MERRLGKKKNTTENRQLPDVVSINTDRLQLIIQRHAATQKSASEWTTPLSIMLALWLVLPITDFRDRFGLTGDQWSIVVLMSAILTSAWFLRRIIAAIRAPTFDDLLGEICANAERLDDHRGLFLFEGRDPHGVDRILVYFDEVWECFLLPHANIQAWDLADVSAESPLAQYAGRLIGVPADQLEVTPLRSLALRSTKFSEFYKREKSYTFEFLHVIVRGKIRPDLLSPSFTSGGREYHWMSLVELLSDRATNIKNKDVIHHLEGHVAEFFFQTPNSFPYPVAVKKEATIHHAPTGEPEHADE